MTEKRICKGLPGVDDRVQRRVEEGLPRVDDRE